MANNQSPIMWLIEQVKSKQWNDMLFFHKEQVFEQAIKMEEDKQKKTSESFYVTVNAVELATLLAASRLDELYQADEISYPYLKIDDYDDEPSTYTEEGQKTFDKWYDWYYGIVTGHDIN